MVSRPTSVTGPSDVGGVDGSGNRHAQLQDSHTGTMGTFFLRLWQIPESQDPLAAEHGSRFHLGVLPGLPEALKGCEVQPLPSVHIIIVCQHVHITSICMGI